MLHQSKEYGSTEPERLRKLGELSEPRIHVYNSLCLTAPEVIKQRPETERSLTLKKNLEDFKAHLEKINSTELLKYLETQIKFAYAEKAKKRNRRRLGLMGLQAPMQHKLWRCSWRLCMANHMLGSSQRLRQGANRSGASKLGWKPTATSMALQTKKTNLAWIEAL